MSRRQKIAILSGAIGVFTAVIMLIAWFKMARFGYNGFDLAIYNQTFWNTIHGHFFQNSMNPPNYLGDHAEWLIILLAPLYAILPHPLTLVFLQTLALALGAIPVWLIAKEKLQSEKLAIFFALLFLANPFLWNLALSEFHIIAFAVPLILLAGFFYLKKQLARFLITCAGLLIIREDVSFVVAGFALLALYDLGAERIKNYRNKIDNESLKKFLIKIFSWVFVPISLALIVFFIDQKIIAHFNPDGGYKFFYYYEWLGNNPKEILFGIFLHPIKVLTHLLSWNNLEVIAIWLMPLFFLALRAPRTLLICAVTGAEFLLMHNGADVLILKMQYASTFIPPLFIASIHGYSQLVKNGKLFWKIIPQPILPLIITVSTIIVWFTYGPAIGLTGKQTDLPTNKNALQEIIKLIPENAAVAASYNTLTQLSSRKYLYPLGYVWIGKKQFGTSTYPLPVPPEYIIVEKTDLLYFAATYPNIEWSAPLYAESSARFRELIINEDYGIIHERNSIALLKREKGAELPFIKIHEIIPAISNPSFYTDNNVRFLGWSAGSGQTKKLYFSSNGKVTGDPMIFLNEKIYLLGNGIYPASDWSPNQIVEINIDTPDDPTNLTLVGIKGALYVNGDGSLSLKVQTQKLD